MMTKLKTYALLLCFAAVSMLSPVLAIMHFVQGGPLWKGLLVIACSVGMFTISVYMILKIMKAKDRGVL